MATPGLLLIDKDSDWTSHDVVAKVRGLAGTRRVGHAGTLDPMATGLLVIGLESATKLLTFLVGENKTYTATIRLGANTVTDDREGDITFEADPVVLAAIEVGQVEAALVSLRGQIMQVPSSVSAIKVDGKRAYAKVRSGDEVKLAPRQINILKFEQTAPVRHVDGKFVDLDVIVECSSGTYIRALARDLGAALKVGGHLTALRRTKVGRYSVEQANRLEVLTKESLDILPIAEAARMQFATIALSAQDEVDLRHGKRLGAGSEFASVAKNEPIAAVNAAGELVAMLEQSGKQLKSLVVFAPQASAPQASALGE